MTQVHILNELSRLLGELDEETCNELRPSLVREFNSAVADVIEEQLKKAQAISPAEVKEFCREVQAIQQAGGCTEVTIEETIPEKVWQKWADKHKDDPAVQECLRHAEIIMNLTPKELDAMRWHELLHACIASKERECTALDWVI